MRHMISKFIAIVLVMAVSVAALPTEAKASGDGTEEQTVADILDESEPEDETEDSTAESDEIEDNGAHIEYDRIMLTGDETFGSNIQIDDIDVSGMKLAEAEDKIKKDINEKVSAKLNIKVSDDVYEYTFADVGVSYDETKLDEVLKESILYGNYGTLIAMYKENKILDEEGKDFDIELNLDKEKVNQVISNMAASYTEQMPQNARIQRVKGEFVITKEVRGVGVDVEKTVAAVIDKINNWKSGDAEVTADVEETLPQITADQLSGIKDLLGSCETKFSDSLTGGRGVNLKNGASKINDVVLMPGDTLSVHDSLAPFTVANGYKTATAYANGGYVDSIGGGICQIATTLYDACLQAEVEVVKRSNHSMVVGYVDRSFDATVNDNGSKDLVIKNNYQSPIYIEAYLYNMQVCVNIYGSETRSSDRKVEYYSKVLSETYPGENDYVYIELKPGDKQYSATNGRLKEELVGPDEILQIQGNYPACKSQLYKRVTVGGKVVEDTCLHTDKYRSSPAKFLVGANYPYPGKVVTTTEAPAETSSDSAAETPQATQPDTSGTTPDHSQPEEPSAE